jgi:hypothetical protein
MRRKVKIKLTSVHVDDQEKATQLARYSRAAKAVQSPTC